MTAGYMMAGYIPEWNGRLKGQVPRHFGRAPRQATQETSLGKLLHESWPRNNPQVLVRSSTYPITSNKLGDRVLPTHRWPTEAAAPQCHGRCEARRAAPVARALQPSFEPELLKPS